MIPAGITPPVLDEMTFFQVAVLVGADLQEPEDDGEMKLVMNRKSVKGTTVVDSSGAVGRIT